MNNVSARWKALLLALAVNFAGCTTPSQPRESLPTASSGRVFPAPDPSLMAEPPEPGSYSASVRRDLSRWADTLTGSPPK